MSASDSSLDATIQHLQEVRLLLLRLHKALLDSERITYEQLYGNIPSKGEFFQLVIGHEWFSWLRPISQFIVQIDEALSAKEPITLNQANELLQEASTLLQPSNQGSTSEQRYYHAIQRDPNIALMHAELSKLLTSEQ
ncbi:MAG: hypothetical protein QNJ47_08730 [Nostocaceae cyanobacterium]|nr:hypothetical protein [Nostocaceae cyanobacterium]